MELCETTTAIAPVDREIDAPAACRAPSPERKFAESVRSTSM
jgi:hypothetical protein